MFLSKDAFPERVASEGMSRILNMTSFGQRSLLILETGTP